MCPIRPNNYLCLYFYFKEFMKQITHHRLLLIVLMLVFSFSQKEVKSQVNANDSTISTFIIYASYAFQIPGGDMANRFGMNSTIGPGFSYKTNGNWIWTAEMNFIFGNDVLHSDEIIEGISTDDGHLIGLDGTYANIRPMERGFTLFAKVGKIIPVFKMNPNSGLIFDFGMGYIQHKIKWDVENNNALQIDGDYKKGYDRFSEGFSLSQSIGLFYLADSRIWNFKVNAEIVEGFTTMKRYNFDTMEGNTSSRIDLFYGLKVAWMIPLYGRAPKAIYYY